MRSVRQPLAKEWAHRKTNETSKNTHEGREGAEERTKRKKAKEKRTIARRRERWQNDDHSHVLLWNRIYCLCCTNATMKASLLCLLPSLASSFVVSPRIPNSLRPPSWVVLQSSGDNEQDESDGLLLSGLDQEMSKVSSKYGFTESDFLAAARKRAEMKMESRNAGATDEEWHQVAKEKKQQFGEIDDWENSAKEAGNIDSQILMFSDASDDSEDEDGEGGEPKLLLF